MKRLNRADSALLVENSYRFVWQNQNPSLDAFHSMKETYLAELDAQYGANHIDKSLSDSLGQLTKSAGLYESAESEFYKSQESVDMLEASPSKLSKASQPKLGKRLGYKRERRRALRDLRKDRRNNGKSLKIQEKDFNKTYEEETGSDKKSFFLFEERQNGFVGNMESLANDIGTLEKRYDKLSSKISVKKGAKNEFREMQRKILEESRANIQTRENDEPANGVAKMLEYLDISSGVSPEQQLINAEYAAVGATLCTLKAAYNEPKRQRMLLVATADNLPLKSKIAFYKTEGVKTKNELEQDQNKEDENKKVEAAKEAVKKDASYISVLKVKNTDIDTYETEIKTIDGELSVLRASRYMTESVKAQISVKESDKANAVANLAGEKQKLSLKADEVLGGYVITEEKSNEAVITQANALAPIIKEQINAVQNTLNNGANEAAEKQLKDLETLLQTLGQRDVITDVLAAKSLFASNTNAPAIGTTLDAYDTAIKAQEAAAINLAAIKSLYTENNIEFNNSLDYSGAIDQEKQKMMSDEANSRTLADADREKTALLAEIEGRKAADILRESINTKEVADFKKLPGYTLYDDSKSKIATVNGKINYLLEVIKELDVTVKRQVKVDGSPSAESLELTAKRAELTAAKELRKTLLNSLDTSRATMLNDREVTLKTIRDELRVQKDKREAARILGTPPGLVAMKVAQTEIDRLNIKLTEASRMINAEINKVQDISSLLASDEKSFNEYLTTVGSGESFVTYGDYVSNRSRTSRTGPSGRTSRTSSAERRQSEQLRKRALKDVPTYKATVSSDEVKDLDTTALLATITDVSVRNELIKLMNLGLVAPVSYSKRIKNEDGLLERKKFKEFVIKVQPRDSRTGDVKSDIYYTVRSDGSLVWKSSVTLLDGTVGSLKPAVGEKYNFKERYSSPNDMIETTLSRLDDHMKNKKRVMSLADDLAGINPDFVHDYNTVDGNTYLDVKVYNPEDEDTFIVRFKMNEKGRWIIDKDEFAELDPSEQDTLKGFGVRGDKKMSRRYFTRRLKKMARQNEDEAEEINPVTKFFRRFGKRVRRGWEWVKGVFGA